MEILQGKNGGGHTVTVRKQRGCNGSFARSDEFYTQAKDVIKILPYVREHMERRAASPDYKGGRILCPFDCDKSQFVKLLKAEGYAVDYGDLNNDHKDFFTSWDLTAYDLIISNPPFSLWNTIHPMLLDLGAPFCMLTRYDGLIDPRAIYVRVKQNQHTMTLLLTKGRRKFVRPDGSISGTPMYISWVANKFNPNQLVFVD